MGMEKTIKMHLQALAYISLLVCPFSLTAQTVYTYRDIISVYSPNGEYYAVSKPYSSTQQLLVGTTEVYHTATDSLMFAIDECMTDGELLISNDGRHLLHLFNYDYRYSRNYSNDLPKEYWRNEAVSFFCDGKLVNRFSIKDFCGTGENRLLFNLLDSVVMDANSGLYNRYYKSNTTARDTLLHERPVYQFGDTVFVYTHNRKLIILDLQKGSFSTHSFDSLSIHKLQSASPQRRIKQQFKCPYSYAKMIDGNRKIESGQIIAKLLDLKTNKNHRDRDFYKFYRVGLWLKVHKSGHAEVVNVYNADSIPIQELYKNIDNAIFDTNDFSNNVDYWYKEVFGLVRKKNRVTARLEKIKQNKIDRIEYRKQLVKDTINGIYIPKNIEECFKELDSMLSPKDKYYIMKSSTINLHHSLGMWLRNNWYLWGGSRLKTYFIDRNITHPDEMSSIILEYYHNYLNGINDEWQKFDKKE